MHNPAVRRMLRRLICFALLLTALVFALDQALFDPSGVTPAWRAVREDDDRPVDVLFVGNSHTYASLDTDVLAQALDKNVQLLRCSSANGGIVAAMLEAYLHYRVPELVVLDAEDVPAGVFQLFRPTAMWSRWQRGASAAAAGYEPYDHFTVQRDYNAAALEDYYRIPADPPAGGALLAQNQQALERILALSEKLDFELWLIAAPVAHYAEGYQQDLRRLYAISQRSDRITLFDNSLQQLSAIGLTAQDFADAGHLCRRGAQKYTQHVLALLAEQRGWQPRLRDVLAYQGEEVRQTGGTQQLRMICYGDALYAFAYEDAQGQPVQTAFSEQDTITLPATISPSSVTVQMKLRSDPDGDGIAYSFMQEKAD